MMLLLISMISVTSAIATPAVKNPWSKVKTPAPGPAESIGSPSAGCVRGAEVLKQDTPGTLLMRPERKRNFGHPRLIALLKEVGASFAKAKWAPLFLGDIGMPRGGPTMSAHASHQSGLDADIWYARPMKWDPKAALKKRIQTPIIGMVDTKALKVNQHFGDAQVDLLRTFAEHDSVDRILVNYPIKRALCDRHAKDATKYNWIRKIRPWYGHDHHFHIRLVCATGDKHCLLGSDPLPDGSGCDKTLDWWWSDEAKEEAKKNLLKQTHPVMPELPKECAAVLEK